MYARRSNELCKCHVRAGKTYCLRYHSRYEQYLDRYTPEEIRGWPKCTLCETPFLALATKKHWKRCLLCQKKKGKYYCSWYARYDKKKSKGASDLIVCTRCTAPNEGGVCKDHFDMFEHIGKECRYCMGCRKPFPVDMFIGKQCPQCNDRGKINRTKQQVILASLPKCKALVKGTSRKCMNKVWKDEYCKKHHERYVVIPNLEKETGLIFCKSRYGCNIFVNPEMSGYNKCTECRIKILYTDYKRKDKKVKRTFNVDYEYFKKLVQYECFYCGTSNYSLNGIDRYHNTEHTEDNVVSCCEACNKGKRDSTPLEFVDRCTHIATINGIDGEYHGLLNHGVFEGNRKWDFSKRRVIRRGGNITIDRVKMLCINSRCTYCNTLNEYNGLDRKDNSVGYFDYNVVPCCKWCNIIKGESSLTDFLERCKGVAERKYEILLFDYKQYRTEVARVDFNKNIHWKEIPGTKYEIELPTFKTREKVKYNS